MSEFSLWGLLVGLAAVVSYFVWLDPDDNGESERYEEEKNRRNAKDLDTLFRPKDNA